MKKKRMMKCQENGGNMLDLNVTGQSSSYLNMKKSCFLNYLSTLLKNYSFQTIACVEPGAC